MRHACGNYEIDDDPARIDPAAAVSFLTTEAWRSVKLRLDELSRRYQPA